jgi:hypothetical protein
MTAHLARDCGYPCKGCHFEPVDDPGAVCELCTLAAAERILLQLPAAERADLAPIAWILAEGYAMSPRGVLS